MGQPLSDAGLDEIVRAVLEHAAAERHEEAWSTARPLLEVQARQPAAARALTDLLQQGAFSHEHALDSVGAVFDAHPDDPVLVGELGVALEAVRDFRFLNAAPPPEPIFLRVAVRLREFLEQEARPQDEIVLLSGLAGLARGIGRTWDREGERCYVRLVE